VTKTGMFKLSVRHVVYVFVLHKFVMSFG
jgi:hypothetical protein